MSAVETLKVTSGDLSRERTMLSEDERDDLIADNNFQHGRDYERERITALLEAELVNLYEPDRDRLIALIKGENK